MYNYAHNCCSTSQTSHIRGHLHLRTSKKAFTHLAPTEAEGQMVPVCSPCPKGTPRALCTPGTRSFLEVQGPYTETLSPLASILSLVRLTPLHAYKLYLGQSLQLTEGPVSQGRSGGTGGVSRVPHAFKRPQQLGARWSPRSDQKHWTDPGLSASAIRSAPAGCTFTWPRKHSRSVANPRLPLFVHLCTTLSPWPPHELSLLAAKTASFSTAKAVVL